MTSRYALLLIAAGLALASPALARQSDLPAQRRAALEKLALGKARRTMLEQVQGLPLGEGLTVGAWTSRRLDADRRLRSICRALPRSGPPRLYSDGVCEIDVRLEPAALLRDLTAILSEFYPDQENLPRAQIVSELRLKGATLQWPVLWATGAAAASEPAGGEKPLGWEDITLEGVEAAKRAAQADALFALTAEAGKLRVTNARRLSDYLNSSTAVRAAVQESLNSAARVSAEATAEQIAVATARITTAELVRIVTAVVQRQPEAGELTAADFREMALLNPGGELVATGYATPPDRTVIRSAYQDIELNAPGWREQTLRVTGRYEPDDDEAPGSAETRAELARLDGLDRLRQRVESLVVQEPVTVRELLAYHTGLKDDIVLFLSSGRSVGAPRTTADGATEMDVELPLRRLWSIVKRGMQRVEVEPPPATAPARP